MSCNELELEFETASVVDRKRCSRSSWVVQHKRRQVCLFQIFVGSPHKRKSRGVKQQQSRTWKTTNGCKVASRENPFSIAAAPKGHPLGCPMALPEFALVLADSTAYGWLEGSTLGGTALVHREAVGGADERLPLVAAVVCGGSLIKKGVSRTLRGGRADEGMGTSGRSHWHLWRSKSWRWVWSQQRVRCQGGSTMP